MQILIIRTDGAEEVLEVDAAHYINAIEKAIGADCLDTVNLRDGRMFVDDHGYETETVEKGPANFEIVPVKALRPFNEKATQLYWSICKPGTTHRIVGDVAIVKDR
jgi:hypothetical protein